MGSEEEPLIDRVGYGARTPPTFDIAAAEGRSAARRRRNPAFRGSKRNAARHAMLMLLSFRRAPPDRAHRRSAPRDLAGPRRPLRQPAGAKVLRHYSWDIPSYPFAAECCRFWSPSLPSPLPTRAASPLHPPRLLPVSLALSPFHLAPDCSARFSLVDLAPPPLHSHPPLSLRLSRATYLAVPLADLIVILPESQAPRPDFSAWQLVISAHRWRVITGRGRAGAATLLRLRSTD